jgi:pyruvate dehydrogenase E1 component alpha subunit
VLEIGTYRYYGHSIADANHKKYRTAEEIERYKKNHDPINLWRARLLEEGVLDEALAGRIDQEAKEEAAAAVRFAEESPPPAVADIMSDIYWESDHATPASSVGRHFFND